MPRRGRCSPGVHRDLPQCSTGVFLLIEKGVFHAVPRVRWGGSSNQAPVEAELALGPCPSQDPPDQNGSLRTLRPLSPPPLLSPPPQTPPLPPRRARRQTEGRCCFQCTEAGMGRHSRDFGSAGPRRDPIPGLAVPTWPSPPCLLTTMPWVERNDNSMSVVIRGRWGARLSPISPDKAANRLYLAETDGSCIVLPAVARQDGGARGTQGPEQEDWGLGGVGVRAHSRAAPQVRVVYLVTQAQPQLAAFLSQGPHGLPYCSHQYPKCLCRGKGSVSTRMRH